MTHISYSFSQQGGTTLTPQDTVQQAVSAWRRAKFSAACDVARSLKGNQETFLQKISHPPKMLFDTSDQVFNLEATIRSSHTETILITPNDLRSITFYLNTKRQLLFQTNN